MNVHDQRGAVARRLRQALSRDEMVVIAPDHPLLLRGPDLLVAREGRLLAIMCGSALEIRRPRLARARLALARAALPPETVFGFVATPATDALGQELSRDLDEVVRLSEAAALARVAPDGIGTGRSKARLEARSKTMARFGSSFRVAQQVARLRGRADPPKRQRVARDRRVLVGGTLEGIAKAELPEQPVATDMLELAFGEAARSFDLQDGVAWPSGTTGVAYARSAPVTRGDPERFARANAFAGWVLSPSWLEPEHARLAHLLRMAAR